MLLFVNFANSVLIPDRVIGISIARLILVIQGQWLADQSWQYNPLLAIEVAEISFTLISLSIPGCKLIFDKYLRKSGNSPTGDGYTDGSNPKQPGHKARRDIGLHYMSQDRIRHSRDDSLAPKSMPDGTSLMSTDAILSTTEFRVDSVPRGTHSGVPSPRIPDEDNKGQ